MGKVVQNTCNCIQWEGYIIFLFPEKENDCGGLQVPVEKRGVTCRKCLLSVPLRVWDRFLSRNVTP